MKKCEMKSWRLSAVKIQKRCSRSKANVLSARSTCYVNWAYHPTISIVCGLSFVYSLVNSREAASHVWWFWFTDFGNHLQFSKNINKNSRSMIALYETRRPLTPFIFTTSKPNYAVNSIFEVITKKIVLQKPLLIASINRFQKDVAFFSSLEWRKSFLPF